MESNSRSHAIVFFVVFCIMVFIGATDSAASALECLPSGMMSNKADTVRAIIYNESLPKKDLLIVISKKDLRLNVYHAPKSGDTTLLAQYPVCLSRNKGNKQRRGDMRTPECSLNRPFQIIQIQNSSTWRHNFNDGRGNILAYGRWFMRLKCPGFSGIGIHGSTNNAHTVPGRDSEGCIRLFDSELIHFEKHYAYVGEPVVIKKENQGLYPFEVRAMQRLKSSATANASGAPADTSVEPVQTPPNDDPNAVSEKFDYLRIENQVQ